MVMGKVLKLFPGQRAMIQIGNQQMNAQLEAALNLNGRYMFQVESAEDLVHLKVLGDAPTGQGEKAVSSLLSQLGMSYGKDRASFVGQLIKQNIPFQQSDLKQAIPLMEKYSASQETKNVLLEMMNRKLPMKESIFLAMRERMGSSPTLTSSLQSLNTAQNQSVDGTQSMLRSLNQPDQSFSKRLISILGDNTKTQSSNSYSLMQKAQLVPSNQNQTNWQAQVKSWVSNTANEASGGPSLQQVPLSQTNEETIAKRMVDLFQKQLPISKGGQQALKNLSENLSRLNALATFVICSTGAS